MHGFWRWLFTKLFFVFQKSSYELGNFSRSCSSLSIRGSVIKMLRLRQLCMDLDVLTLTWKKDTICRFVRRLFTKWISVFPKWCSELCSLLGHALHPIHIRDRFSNGCLIKNNSFKSCFFLYHVLLLCPPTVFISIYSYMTEIYSALAPLISSY
jgi:hypothetical protein